MVREMFEQIKKALRVDLYILALSSALMIPDIAGAIDSDDGLASKKKYIKWYDTWVGSACKFMDGEICYQIRCSYLHQGTFNLGKGNYKRVIFLHPKVKGIYMHCNVMNDALNLDIGRFCLDIIAGAEKWLLKVENTPLFKTNYDKFMRTYPNGLPPYIVGVPVIS
jgi:hypothetical protein